MPCKEEEDEVKVKVHEVGWDFILADTNIIKNVLMNSNNTKNPDELNHQDFLYPRRESNSNLRFRKPLFYPLNYKGLFNAQFIMHNYHSASNK